ncbi:hypothetical protein [Nocardia transvalensis]|uniref:hypothetical protein n=1 Tax=Nocardia transvalensis TaxID=37333 RepID=UPI0018963040|nr:hypothetical protein [Nocardia transvalensis]MBF6331787.1 hypothetical protein [Nocardia transvalensis]
MEDLQHQLTAAQEDLRRTLTALDAAQADMQALAADFTRLCEDFVRMQYEQIELRHDLIELEHLVDHRITVLEEELRLLRGREAPPEG